MVIQSYKLANSAWALLIIMTIGSVVFILFNQQFNYIAQDEFLAKLWPVSHLFVGLVLATYAIHLMVKKKYSQRVDAQFTQVGINLTQADGVTRLIPWKEMHKIEASIKPSSLFHALHVWYFFSPKGIIEVPNDMDDNNQQLDLLNALELIRNVDWTEYQAFMKDSQKLVITEGHTYKIWQHASSTWGRD